MGKVSKPETRKKFTQQQLTAMIEDCFFNNCHWLSADGKCNNPFYDFYHEECPYDDTRHWGEWDEGWGLAEYCCEEFQSR